MKNWTKHFFTAFLVVLLVVTLAFAWETMRGDYLFQGNTVFDRSPRISDLTASRLVTTNASKNLATTTTISQATHGVTAMDGVAIGGTTPAAGAFTTLALGAVTTTSHNYGGAAADWVLTAAEARAGSATVTNANGAVNMVLPAGTIKFFHVKNTSGQALTVKYSGSTGVAIASTKQQIVFADGAEVKTVLTDY